MGLARFARVACLVMLGIAAGCKSSKKDTAPKATTPGDEISGKRLELLKETLPNSRVWAFFGILTLHPTKAGWRR